MTFAILLRRSILAGFGCLLAAAPARAETENQTMLVQGVVQDRCRISATPMAFGLLAGQVGRPTTTARISLSCTPNINYAVSIDRGQNARGRLRRMRNPDNGRFLAYRIYSNAGLTQQWDDRRRRRVEGNTGATGQVSLTAYGEIRTANAQSRSGAYFDAVVVTVEF